MLVVEHNLVILTIHANSGKPFIDIRIHTSQVRPGPYNIAVSVIISDPVFAIL